jgi:heme/copper-type cytochrome/quinol oxidase subunit 3
MTEKYRIGMSFFIASEAVFFIVLILAFVFYRDSPANRGGPTPFNSLDVGRMAIFTACLYLSSLTVHMAGRGHRQGNEGSWRLWLLLTIGLGAAFLFGETTEYTSMIHHFGATPERNLFGSTFYALTGFHGFHVFIGLSMLAILFSLTQGGYLRAGRRRGAVEAISLYWHFVDGVWVVIFPTVYVWALFPPPH